MTRTSLNEISELLAEAALDLVELRYSAGESKLNKVVEILSEHLAAEQPASVPDVEKLLEWLLITCSNNLEGNLKKVVVDKLNALRRHVAELAEDIKAQREKIDTMFNHEAANTTLRNALKELKEKK